MRGVALPDLGHLPWLVRWRVRFLWAFGFKLKFDARWPEYDHAGWFNLSCGTFGIWFPSLWRIGYVPIWPYNAFRRVYDDASENCWGVGLLQVGGRHLLAVVSNSGKLQVDVCFVHVVHESPRQSKEGGAK